MSAALRLPVIVDDGAAVRPRTRGECQDGERPCPWTSCGHHAIHGVLLGAAGAELTDDAAVELLTTMPETCTLDVADQGDAGTLEVVGNVWGITRERIRQIEAKALRRVRRAAEDIRADLSEDALPAALAKPAKPALPARIDWMGEGDDPAETDTAPAAMGAEETDVKVQRKNLPAPARASTGSGVHAHATGAVCVVPGCGAPPKAWRIELAPELRGLCALHRQRALRWRVDYPQQSAAAALAWVLSRAEATQAQGAQGAEAARHDVFEDEQREAFEALEPPVRPAPADVSELARAQVSLDAAARALEEQNAVAARLREERELATAALARVREDLERAEASLRDRDAAMQGMREESDWLLSQRDAARAEAADLRRERVPVALAQQHAAERIAELEGQQLADASARAPRPLARLAALAKVLVSTEVWWLVDRDAEDAERWIASGYDDKSVDEDDAPAALWSAVADEPDAALDALVEHVEGVVRARIEALTAALGGA